MPENTLESQLNPEVYAGLRAVLFAIEPEICRLQAVVSNPTILTTAPENVEPVALTVLTVGGEAAERVMQGWRKALDLILAN